MTCRLNREQDIHAQFAPWSQTVDLYLFQVEFGPVPGGIGPIGRKPIRFEAAVIGDDTVQHEPSISLSTLTAQRLMDQLWNCGFRPTEGSGSAGSLAATQRHLEDMRVIAFSQLKIQNENGPQVSNNPR